MDDRRPSRIEEARRRASRAKMALVAGAAAAFLAVGTLAWITHPGQSKATTGSSSTGSSVEDLTGSVYDDDGYYDDDGFSYGSGSIAPSGGSQPQVGTSVS